MTNLRGERGSQGIRGLRGPMGPPGPQGKMGSAVMGAIVHSAIDGIQSDTLAVQSAIADAVSSGLGVHLLGAAPIQLLDTGSTIKNIPSYTRLTCAPDTQIHFDQPLRYVLYSAADDAIPLGNIAVTQTVSTVAITNALASNPAIDDTLFLHVSDNGGVYDVIALGQAIIGTTSIATGSLYGGSSTLDGLTLKLNVDGAGEQTLTLAKATNVATKAALLAAILVKWPALNLCIADSATNHLVVSAVTSIAVGSGTANTLLGLVTGSATNLSIVVDRPIIWSLPIGATVDNYINTPHDIDIDMRGAQLYGAAGQPFEVTTGRRYSLRNVSYHYRATDTAHSVNTVGALDIATRDSEICNVVARNDNKTPGALFFGMYGQGNEKCIIRDCRFTGFNEQGCGFTDSYACRSLNNWTVNCGYAHVLVGDFSVGVTYGCIDCSIEGGGDINSQISLYISGSTRGKVINFSSIGAVVYGAMIDFFVGDVTVDTTLMGCSFIGAPTGVYVAAGVTGTKCYGLNTNECHNGITCAGSIEVYGWKMHTTTSDPTYAFGTFNGAGPNVITGLDLYQTGESGGIVIGSTGETTIRSGAITVGAVSTCVVLNAAGTVYLDNIVFTGAYGICANAGTIIVGPNCDFSGCSVAAFLPGAGKIIWMNRGGVLSLSLAAYTNYLMSAAQSANLTIEVTGTIADNTHLKVLPMPGSEWTVVNSTSGAHTLSFEEYPLVGSGVTIAQGKSAIVRCNSAGVIVRVTADT